MVALSEMEAMTDSEVVQLACNMAVFADRHIKHTIIAKSVVRLRDRCLYACL
jgi:hypothetical protein